MLACMSGLLATKGKVLSTNTAGLDAQACQAAVLPRNAHVDREKQARYIDYSPCAVKLLCDA